MPIFEYVCRDCHHRFETLVTAERQPACPTCHGQTLDKQFSTFAVGSKSMTVPHAPAPCGTCGDPRGAGSCGLN